MPGSGGDLDAVELDNQPDCSSCRLPRNSMYRFAIAPATTNEHDPVRCAPANSYFDFQPNLLHHNIQHVARAAIS